MTDYPEIQLNIKLDEITQNHDSDRNKLRKLVISEFAKEIAGKGIGELATKYKYVVEILDSGDKVYITRPAFNKMGFDFLIHVENNSFSNNRDNPSHQDLIDDMKLKIENNSDIKDKILIDLEKIFKCHEADDVVDYNIYDSIEGLPIDLILKTSKWFFIEQDIRYWNYSGRNMLMNAYKEILV